MGPSRPRADVEGAARRSDRAGPDAAPRDDSEGPDEASRDDAPVEDLAAPDFPGPSHPDDHAAAHPAGDGVHVDPDTVRALLREQQPQWADLPLHDLDHTGTDHAMLRLGADLVVRLPRMPWAVRTLRLEQEWLLRIADRLPVPTPVPIAIGRPSAHFPWPWSVCRWLTGTTPVPGELADPHGLAHDLAALIRALRAVDPKDAPPTVWPAPLHEEDARVREQLPRLDGGLDVEAAALAWRHAIEAAPCPRRTFIHGDLAAGNLLLRDGRLAAVLDFSALGLGDPASDLRPAWNLLPAEARPTLRAAVGADDAEWARARGWALLQAVAQLALFTQRNPWLAGTARRVLVEIADEVRAGRL